MASPRTHRERFSVSIAVLVSLGAGVLLGFAIRINATLGTYVGALEATFVVHLVGTVFAVALLRTRLDGRFARRLIRRPSHELSGGLLGVGMVLIANVVVPALGTALAVSLFIGADLFFSCFADHFGWFGVRRIRISWQRVGGLMLALAGILLILWA